MPKRKTAPARKDTTSSMSNAFNNEGVELPKIPKVVNTKTTTTDKASKHASTSNKSASKAVKAETKSAKRRAGKSSDPNFSKLTLYVKTDTVTEVKKKLLGTSQDASELAEKLFSDWLKKKS